MNSVIIFDVTPPELTQDVITGMTSRGYFKNWVSKETRQVNLPKNVIWKPDTESQQALDDIQAVVAGIVTSGRKCNLDRCVILNSTPWRAIFGTP